MPGPIELLTDPISLVIFAIYGGFILWEALAPARPPPRVPWWRLKGIAAFFAFFFLSSYLPLLWNDLLAPWQLLDLTSLGVAGGTVVGLLVYELGQWIWHRAMHNNGLLWRTFHQMHHSAERLDTFGAYYFGPFDMIGWTALSSLALVLVVGVVPEAAALIVIGTSLLSIFQHSNIRTPRWLGFIIQRPESHTVHHARGVHAYNYADLAFIDLLFGTFQNPAGYEHETGFYQGASSRMVDMLVGKDVSKPPRARPAQSGIVAACGSRPC